jgi:hypothetical protein
MAEYSRQVEVAMAGTTIARSSGVSVVESDGRILIVDLGTSWAHTAAFVAALLFFIPVAFAVVLAVSGGPLWVCVGFFVAGAVFAIALQFLVGHIRERKRAAPESLPVLLVFDLAAGKLLDGAGQVLAPLSEVSVGHRFQVGSSSRALEACWADGSRVFVCGNPFAGGLGPVEDALRAKGIRFD